MADENLVEQITLRVQDAQLMSYAIDSNLNVAGAAADAKAVGDRFAALNGGSIPYAGAAAAEDGSIKATVDSISSRTGEDWPISTRDSTPIASVIEGIQNGMNGSDIPVDDSAGAESISTTVAGITQRVDGIAENVTSMSNTLSTLGNQAVRMESQSLSEAQKATARGNIGAAADEQVVKVNAQSLTDSQKSQARENIGAVGSADAVSTSEQSFTDAQKMQVRNNIGAAGTGEAVLATAEQSFTENQKAQARQNIGAMSADPTAALAGLWLRRGYGYEFSDLAAGATLSVTKTNFEIETIEGYEIFTMSRVYCANGNAVVTRWQAQGEATVVTIRNMGSSAISGTVNIDMIYIKSGLRG